MQIRELQEEQQDGNDCPPHVCVNIYRFVVPVAPDTFPAFVKSIVQIVCLFLLLAHMINRAGVFAGGFIDARIAGTTVAALYVRHVLGFLLDQAGLDTYTKEAALRTKQGSETMTVVRALQTWLGVTTQCRV